MNFGIVIVHSNLADKDQNGSTFGIAHKITSEMKKKSEFVKRTHSVTLVNGHRN